MWYDWGHGTNSKVLFVVYGRAERMHDMKFSAVAVTLVCISMSVTAYGQDSYGSSNFASFLNNTGRFHHANNFGGAEVIYRSSGVANQADAMRWWMNSPPHRRLIQAGMIQEIRCVGNVCVGRGGGSGGSVSNDVTYTSMGETQNGSNCTSCGNNYGNSRRIRLFRRR